MYDENINTLTKKHSLNLEGRRKLKIEGVQDVRGFDENLGILKTAQGDLNIRGQELHVDKIELELGELELTGNIQELSYDEPSTKTGLLRRFFG